MKLILDHTQQETPDALSFFFTPQEPVTWKTGQFLHYMLPHENADDRKDERYFTISSAPHESFVRLTTRFAGEQGSSFKKALQQLKPGDEITADPPEGDFLLGDPNETYVFIAGGIGVTPFRAMLMDMDSRNLPMHVQLLYANRTEDAVFKQEFADLTRKHPSFSVEYFIGERKIDAESIRQTVPDLMKPLFYVSGPEPMVEAMEKMLIGMGIPDDRIKRDFFPGYDWP